MAEEATHSASIEVPAAGAHGEAGGDSLMWDKKTGPQMVGLTWITFILMTIVLYKVAWKPILKALEMREDSIRKALDEAAKARSETAALETRQQQMLKDSQAEAQKIISEARVAAKQTADMIEAKAGQEAKELVENAKREIGNATDKARAELRRETAELAIAMATKIVAENMDSSKNRTMVEKLIKEI